MIQYFRIVSKAPSKHNKHTFTRSDFRERLGISNLPNEVLIHLESFRISVKIKP